jgi:HSP20 family protein
MSDEKNFFEKLAGVTDEDIEISNEKREAKQKTKEKHISAETEKNDKEVVENDIDFEGDEGHLTIDVYQDEDNIVIESTVAGVDSENLDISITPESVSIRGKRERKEKVAKDNYLYQECFWGRFSRSVILPQEIDPDKSRASIKNGILKIVLPKVQRSKSKKIKVKFD